MSTPTLCSMCIFYDPRIKGCEKNLSCVKDPNGDCPWYAINAYGLNLIWTRKDDFRWTSDLIRWP